MRHYYFFIFISHVLFMTIPMFCMNQFFPQFPFIDHLSATELRQANFEYKQWEKRNTIKGLQKKIEDLEKDYDRDVGYYRDQYHMSDKSWHEMKLEAMQSKNEAEILQRQIAAWDSVKYLKPMAVNLCKASKILPVSYDEAHPCIEEIKSTSDAFSGKIPKKPLLLITAAQRALKGAEYLIKEFINEVSCLNATQEQHRSSSESTIQQLEQQLLESKNENERMKREEFCLKEQLREAHNNFNKHDAHLQQTQNLLDHTKKSLEEALKIKKDTIIQDSQKLAIDIITEQKRKAEQQRNFLGIAFIFCAASFFGYFLHIQYA